jgi:hypothetical protein
MAESRKYWVLTSLMCLSGGLLVVAYLESDIVIKPILAINLGASTPLIIQAFVSRIPAVEPGRID